MQFTGRRGKQEKRRLQVLRAWQTDGNCQYMFFALITFPTFLTSRNPDTHTQSPWPTKARTARSQVL